jgi:histidinol-phosphate aminotransferase
MPLPIHDYILKIKPYKPGKPNEEVEREYNLTSSIKLASNENCLGPSPKAMKALRKSIERSHIYPDGGAYHLTKRLSEITGFPVEQIAIGSGSTEIIQQTAQMLLGRDSSAVASAQAFVMYNIASQAACSTIIEPPMKDGTTHDLEAMAAAIREDTRIVFIANPNNPTGTYVTKDELKAFFAKVPEHILVVVDEAYREYVEQEDYPNASEYLHAGRQVMVLRTFSKIYGLAGLRMGYALTTPELVEGLNRVRSPFNTTSLGQAAALHALDDQAHVEKSKKINRMEKDFLYGELKKRNIHFIPSVANFIMIDVAMDCQRFFEQMLPLGVIVRPVANYRFPKHIRLSIGLREENEAFLQAMDKVLG